MVPLLTTSGEIDHLPCKKSLLICCHALMLQINYLRGLADLEKTHHEDQNKSVGRHIWPLNNYNHKLLDKSLSWNV